MPEGKGKEEEYRDLFREVILAGCLNGRCYILAIALSRGTGWPIIGLMRGDVIAHAVVRGPESWWDARGPITENEIGAPFGMSPPYCLTPVAENELMAKIRKPMPISCHEIENILRMAQCAWPELPWKTPSRKEQVLSFAEELKALSRKYGLWIRSSNPTYPPMVVCATGNEGGYEVTPQAASFDGIYYGIKRVFSRSASADDSPGK